MRAFYELQKCDVGARVIVAFGAKWRTVDFIGRVLASDIGKRVYKVGDVLQVENDAQRAARVAGPAIGGAQ